MIVSCFIPFVTFRSNSDDLNQTIQNLERQKESTEVKNNKLEENLGEHIKVHKQH